MKNEFMAAIKQVCSERNLPREVVFEAIEVALISAYRRNYGTAQNISAKIDPSSGQARLYAQKEVVETVEDERLQVSLFEAKEIDEGAELGGTVMIEVTPNDFGRIAAQTAKQVILQRIHEAERDVLYTTYADREGEIVNGVVQSINPHAIVLNLGRTEALLSRHEQIPTERYYIGQRLRAYVVEVNKTNRGPQIIVSRTHRHMLRRLLELEVPEIFNGTVEIKTIAREAGSRSKVAVAALQEGIDPVGSCVGMRGVRIQSIVNELNGEKIDVVEWDPDMRVFIANALSPAKVVSVELEEDEKGGKTATVVVPDKQLSLAIGRAGQNARLAAKLTGWRIDIKSASEAAEEARRRAAQAAKLAEILFEGEIETEELKAAMARLYHAPLGELEISTRVHNCLEGAGMDKIGRLLERLAKGEEELLAIQGFGVKSLAELREKLRERMLAPAEVPLLEEEEVRAEEVEEMAAEEMEELEAIAPVEIPIAVQEPEEEEEEWEAYEEEDFEEEELEEERRKKSRQRKRRLVYDEALGEVVVERRRKPSRRRDEWEAEIER